MKFLSWLPLLFLFSCSQGPDPRTLWHNRKSVQRLVEKDLEASQKELIEAFQYDPFQPELHLNLGLNLELQKDNEKALQQYLTAEKYSQNQFQRFISRFNRAQLLARLKKIPEALEEYQRALEIVPSSKEVKTNIELLTQQSRGQGKGESENKDQNKSDDGKEGKDQKNKKDDQEKQDKKDEQKKDVKQSPKYQPREFKGELNPGDIKKILDEIKQQEQKIRAEYNKRNDYKEKPRDKDW